jgi:hypothetical protein
MALFTWVKYLAKRTRIILLLGYIYPPHLALSFPGMERSEQRSWGPPAGSGVDAVTTAGESGTAPRLGRLRARQAELGRRCGTRRWSKERPWDKASKASSGLASLRSRGGSRQAHMVGRAVQRNERERRECMAQWTVFGFQVMDLSGLWSFNVSTGLVDSWWT